MHSPLFLLPNTPAPSQAAFWQTHNETLNAKVTAGHVTLRASGPQRENHVVAVVMGRRYRTTLLPGDDGGARATSRGNKISLRPAVGGHALDR